MKKLLYLLITAFFFVISVSASAHISPTATVTQIDTIKSSASIDQ